MTFPTVTSSDRWFDDYYPLFRCVRHNCIEVEQERLALQVFDSEVGRLLHKKEEEIGHWHLNEVWKSYLGFEAHSEIEKLYQSFHKRLYKNGFDTDILGGLLTVGICIVAEERLRNDTTLSNVNLDVGRGGGR